MAKSILKKLKEHEREQRCQLIIKAAKSLYKKKSFHKIGMRDIASETGISVASLYQYFPSQNDLYVEILKSDLNSIKKKLWTEKTSLEEISIDIVNYFADNDYVFQIVTHLMIKGYKDSKALNKFKDIQVIFIDLLGSAMEKAGSNTNVSIYSQAFFTALFGNVITFKNFTESNNDLNRENLYHIVRITSSAFQGAFQSNKGIKNTPYSL